MRISMKFSSRLTLIGIFGYSFLLLVNGCPECFENRTVTEYYSCTAQRRVSFSQAYTEQCGWWLGVSRCARYRQAYRYESYSRTCTRTVLRRFCCNGWSGAKCILHPNPPSIQHCPVSFTTQSSSGTSNEVSWENPIFSDDCGGFNVTIVSSHSNPSTLTWGHHTVTYIGRNVMNNRESTCIFNITVTPPMDKPEVPPYKSGDDIRSVDGTTLNLVCRADYGKPPMELHWFQNRTEIVNETRNRIESSDYQDYQNAISELTKNVFPKDDNTILTCIGIKRDTGREEFVNLNLKVRYDADPNVDFCPENIYLESASESVNVSWNQPRFSDRNGDELIVTSNIPHRNHSFVFRWGRYEVIYTAVNSRTQRQSFCQFTVVVSTTQCEQLSNPIHGAVVCGNWSSHFMQICMFMCDSMKDIEVTSTIASIYACGSTGNWLPNGATRDISCNRERIGQRVTLPSSLHYYDGPCPSHGAHHMMKSNFLQVINQTDFGHLCSSGQCDENVVSIEC